MGSRNCLFVAHLCARSERPRAARSRGGRRATTAGGDDDGSAADAGSGATRYAEAGSKAGAVGMASSPVGSTGTVVYRGKGTSYTERGLSNGVEYRYVLVTVDKTGNASAGVATVAMPKANLLRLPADGARLTKIPKQFRWTPDPRATYYNLQLYSGVALVAQSTASAGEKILSVFPTKPFYKFKSPWKWNGRTHKMTKGSIPGTSGPAMAPARRSSTEPSWARRPSS